MQSIVVWARTVGLTPPTKHTKLFNYLQHTILTWCRRSDFRSRVSLFLFCLLSSILSEELNTMEAAELCGNAPGPALTWPPFQNGGKQNAINFPQNHELASLQSTQRSGSKRKPSFIVYSLFLFLAGTLWITPEMVAWTHWPLTPPGETHSSPW